MRTDNRQTIKRESWESQRAAGRYNPASVALWRSKYGKHRLILSAGDSDSVYFFRERTMVYALSVNDHCGYIGVQSFNEATNDEREGVFSQNPDDDFPGIMELTPIWQAKTLAAHLNECFC